MDRATRQQLLVKKIELAVFRHPLPRGLKFLQRSVVSAANSFSYSPRTRYCYWGWIRRFVVFHRARRTREFGLNQITSYLSHLASVVNAGPATQNQAMNALAFFYKGVLGKWLGNYASKIRVRQPSRLPTVLSRGEAERVLILVRPPYQLLARLIYGSGLRLMEALRLRVQDLDLSRAKIAVRDGRGKIERETLLPTGLKSDLTLHLKGVKLMHEIDLKEGFGMVWLPLFLQRDFNRATQDWNWQYVFPAASRSCDQLSGFGLRHHLLEDNLQRAMKLAARAARISKPVSCQILRHTFAVHLLEAGYDIRAVQLLLGHSKVTTTLVYTQVMVKPGLGVKSPLDL